MRTACLVLIGLAVVLRGVLVSHATWVPASDSRDYHDFARSLLRGDGYVQVYRGETGAFRDLVLHAYRMPGYPAFLALVWGVAGFAPRAALAANVACDLATMLAVAGIGRAVLSPGAAIAAVALCGARILYTPSLTSESLFTALFLALAWIQAARLGRPGPRAAFVFGVTLAAAVFVRPIGVAALPAALWAVGRSKAPRRAIRVVLVAAPLVLALGAWTIRNARVTGAFVPLSTNFGTHNASSFGIEFEPVAVDVRRRGGGEVEIDRVLRAEIARRVRRDPAAAWRVYQDRVVGLFQRRPDWITERILVQRTFAPPVPPWVQRLYTGSRALHPVTDVLAIGGALLLVVARRSVGGLWITFAAFVLLHAAVSRSDERFAAPLYPFLALAAGHALAFAGARARMVVLRRRGA